MSQRMIQKERKRVKAPSVDLLLRADITRKRHPDGVIVINAYILFPPYIWSNTRSNQEGSMTKKVAVISSGAVLIVAAAGYFLFAGNGTKKYDFRFDKISRGDLNVVVTTTGTINAVISVDVGTQVSGIISALYADFNSVVKKGNIIARIDTTFLWQSLKDAEAALDRARAQAADSKRTFDRQTALLAKGLDSQMNYDAALTAYESNRAGLKQAIAAVDRAKINLSYATIVAPVNGVVINRAVNVGQTVAASFSSPLLFTIANDLSKMQVLTTVDESDIGMISIGQNATFTVDAYPEQKFVGTVSQIRLAPVSIQNVVNYTVVIAVDNGELKLMPGMTANVSVAVANARDVLKVPNLALRFQPPADLVDSSRVQAQRDASPGRNAPAPESLAATSGRGRDAFAGGAVVPGGEDGGKTPGSSLLNKDGGAFRNVGAIRDSILAAHGGTMDPEELRSEVEKVLAGMRNSPSALRPAAGGKRSGAGEKGGTSFGITNVYPQYEKSPYVPQHHSGRGRIWILNAQKKLEPMFVRTGVTDGRFTEITTMNLKAGDQIVMGATSNSDIPVGSPSPLTGGGQQRPGGGGPR